MKDAEKDVEIRIEGKDRTVLVLRTEEERQKRMF